MKVLVTGANGLLGSNLVRELNRRQIEVRILIREHANISGLQGADYELKNGNITDPDSVQKAVMGCTHIIHAAANTGHWPNDLKHYVNVNIQGTNHLIDAAKKLGIQRFVFVSTANTIGYGSKDIPGSEKNEMAPLFSQSGYAMSKKLAENILLEEIQQQHLDGLILNPTFMIGPYDSKPSSGQILLMLYNKRIIYLPVGGKNFIDVRNVAFACCEALSLGKSGERYLLSNQNLSYMEFASLVCEYARYKPVIVPLGTKLLKFLGSFSESLSKTGLHIRFNTTFGEILGIGNYYCADKAINDLNLPQTPIQKAIEDALQWFMSTGIINKLRLNQTCR